MERQQKHTYDAILDKESKERLGAIDEKIARLELKMYHLRSGYEVLKRKQERPGGDGFTAADRDSMQGFFEDMGECTRQINQARKDRENLTNLTDKKYKFESDKVYEGTRNVEQRTGKNRLYVGNRQFVAGYASKDEMKKKRTLDVGVWSWGLNFAWIEGGTDAGVEVKIKVNEENPNAFESIPEEAWFEILAHPAMNGDQWLKLCSGHPGTLLWVTKDGESRPSWTALEIKACLDANYVFVAYQHKKRQGQALKLVKRMGGRRG